MHHSPVQIPAPVPQPVHSTATRHEIIVSHHWPSSSSHSYTSSATNPKHCTSPPNNLYNSAAFPQRTSNHPFHSQSLPLHIFNEQLSLIIPHPTAHIHPPVPQRIFTASHSHHIIATHHRPSSVSHSTTCFTTNPYHCTSSQNYSHS